MTLPISVVIPCYKQERWLMQAADSALLQADDVTVIYDDSDGGYSGNYHPNVGSFRVGNPFRAGVCYARNQGINEALNSLIVCLDADDRLYPDALQRMYEAWKPGTFVYGRYMEIDEDENDIREMDCPPPQMIFRKNLTYSTFLFSRDDWERVGGYDPLYEFADEDWAFQVALINGGIQPIQLGGAPLYRRMIHQSGSRTERAIKYYPLALELLREQYPAVMKR